MRNGNLIRLIGSVALVTAVVGILSVLLLSIHDVARATHPQVEHIGPFDIFGFADEKEFGLFDNKDFPPPVVKELEFINSTATNPGGGPRTLLVYFDYMDALGVKQFTPAVAHIIPGGATINVDTAHQLDFCPKQVSIHFETVNGSILDIEGDFVHTCVVLISIGGTTELLVSGSDAPSESGIAGWPGDSTLPIAAAAGGVLVALAGAGLFMRRRLVR
ncbi:MAG: hypothetical protein IH940_00145 [Acidobacteria bacterium]|nr:hypothetical protein [Acidobacteriota bacterium]